MRCIAFSQVAQEKSVSYEPACLSLCPQNANHFAVGDGSNSGMAVYIYDAGTLEEIKTIKVSGSVTSVAYSPDGQHLVVGDSNRKVTLFNVAAGYEKAHTREWGFHSAKVTKSLITT